MKKNLLIAISIATLTIISSAWAADNQKEQPKVQQAKEVQKVSMDTVKQAVLDKSANVVIADVRDSDHYDEAHIAGAIHECHKKYHNFEGDETEFPGLTKDGINYIYSYTDNFELAEKACRKFSSLGYPCKVMIGGFDSWQEAGYPVESTPEKEKTEKQK